MFIFYFLLILVSDIQRENIDKNGSTAYLCFSGSREELACCNQWILFNLLNRSQLVLLLPNRCPQFFFEASIQCNKCLRIVYMLYNSD